MKIFLKKYWWIVLPLPLIILYWLNKSSTAPTAFNGNAGGSQSETGNPVSGENNPGNVPGGSNNPTPAGAVRNTTIQPS